MAESENAPDRRARGKSLDAQMGAMGTHAGKRLLRTSVASASAILLAVGAALWLVVIFVEVDSLTALKFYGTAVQLWPFLVGAAAIGWLINQALPDD